MMYSNVMVGITISRGSFVFGQSLLTMVKVSTSLTNIHEGSLAVGAFDLVDCSLSVVRFVPDSFTLVSHCRNVLLGLWATR